MQARQPMQRFLLKTTGPRAVLLSAVVGHADAHAGWSTTCTPPCRPGSRCSGCCPGSSPSASARASSRGGLLLDVAEEHLGLWNRRVGVTDASGQVVGDVTGHDARVAPVPGQADLVEELAVDEERLEAL